MSKKMDQSYRSVGSSMRRRAATECRCGEEITRITLIKVIVC